MSEPQQLRVYLGDGPYRGETLSIARTSDGEVPRLITIGAQHSRRGPHGLTGHREAPDEPDAQVSYQFDHADMVNGVWVYRTASASGGVDLS